MVVRDWGLRVLLLALWGFQPGWAAPPLTTIQDVLYKADGSPFNGFLVIDWTSFQAADTSNIATQSLTVPVVNGVVLLRLVPNATGSSYTVRYSSDGKIQFQETWVVPASTSPLRLTAVRSSSSGAGSGPSTQPPGDSTTVAEADVVGLVADLGARPVKGAGYAASRAAVINASGALEAAVGSLGDCLHVDGTSGSCGAAGSAGPGFVDSETPSGLLNGTNQVFTLANTPNPSTSLTLYRNGVLQNQGLDYSVTDNVISFVAASAPQSGDTVTASYRLADMGNPLGTAGGALAGTYPNPSLALGVVGDANVADAAGIKEAKLALNYPTHSNANDPTSDQKAAMAGTTGTASASNKFVTDQDARLSDARTPASHALLSTFHSDTSGASPVRGDLIVGQGAVTRWTRLPLGAANRCLMSNGSDVVWNTCLYTGFPVGAVPFVDVNGNLSQSSTRLYWDNTNRRLSVGNSGSGATLYVWDSLASTGSTALTVQAGAGQGTNPLTRWLDASATELARVDPDGRITGKTFTAGSSATRAAWQDAGYSSDPSSFASGDQWFNTAGNSRKSVEGGQAHTQVQVLCSSTGTATSSMTLTQLGSCTIPAALLKPGDRLELRFDYSHEGSTVAPAFEVHWGATTVVSRSGAAAETALGGHSDIGVHTSGAQWHTESWGATLTLAGGAGSASDSLDAAITVSFLGRMTGSTSTETLTLRNFSVIRYPLQQNP